MNRSKFLLPISLTTILAQLLVAAEPVSLKSPDGRLELSFQAAPDGSLRHSPATTPHGTTTANGTIWDRRNSPLPTAAEGMDFSWVKPGLAVWDWRIKGAVAGDFTYDMSLPSWLRMVDFAAANGMPHLMLDAKRVFQPKTFVTTGFGNMLAGPLDMNNGMFDLPQGKTTRVDNPTPVPSTLVSEAARTLIVFSGVTILPDIPEFYQKYPDLLNSLASHSAASHFHGRERSFRKFIHPITPQPTTLT